MFGTLLNKKEKRAEPLKKLKYGDKVKLLQNRRKNYEETSKLLFKQVDWKRGRSGPTVPHFKIGRAHV